jgi:hypothetical protein
MAMPVTLEYEHGSTLSELLGLCQREYEEDAY